MCSTIMNLLSLANEDSVPGADDFVPVLVFVLIRVSLFFLICRWEDPAVIFQLF